MVDYTEYENFAPGISIMGTDTDNPDAGRVFVWTKMGWFERLEVDSGNVAFSAIAESEEELRELIARDSPLADLFELDAQFVKMVKREFLEQSISPSDSYFQTNQEISDDNQEYHQHDL